MKYNYIYMYCILTLFMDGTAAHLHIYLSYITYQ